MIKNIFVNKYYIKYYDNKDCTYYFPTPLYDINGEINDEMLVLTLNKIKKILNVREINLILLDPNSYAINIKNNETIEDVYLYVDNTKFKSFDYIEKYGAVLNFDIASINAIEEAAFDLKIKINLISFIDYCMLNISFQSNNIISFVIDKNFYCFLIFKNGKLIKYFYDDRTNYNERAIENMKVNNPNAEYDEIYQNLNFEIVGSSIASILSIIDEPSDFILNKYFYTKNESINSYISTIGFNTINEISFNQNIDKSISLINSKKHKKYLLNNLKYIILAFLSIAIFLEIFYYSKIKEEITMYEQLIIEQKNINISNLIENEKNSKKLENIEKINKEYEEILYNNIFLNSEMIFNIIDELSRNFEIRNIKTNNGNLFVELYAYENLPDKYNIYVLKETNKNGHKIFELKFEVSLDEVK